MLGVFGVSVMQGGVSFCYAFIPAERKTVRRVIDVQNYMFLNLLVITALAIMLYSYFHIIKTFKRQNEKLRKPQVTSSRSILSPTPFFAPKLQILCCYLSKIARAPGGVKVKCPLNLGGGYLWIKLGH